MSIQLGIVMDPIHTIQTYKDSSFAMLLAAQRRGWSINYMEINDLYIKNGQAMGCMRPLSVTDNSDNWFELGDSVEKPLGELDILLMRKDPPVDTEFLYSTHILQLAEEAGCLVANRPESIRSVNEKLYTCWFTEHTPETLVSRDPARIRAFFEEVGDVVVKPLDGMGGASVFRLKAGDTNLGVILETITDYGQRTVMAQRFLPEYTQGDKRILMIDGEPVPYALARIPAKGEGRANLAAGGHGEGRPLTDSDYAICKTVGPELKKRGLYFVGLDVIGEHLTEINVTSPTCIRELDAQFNLDIAGDFLDCLYAKLGK